MKMPEHWQRASPIAFPLEFRQKATALASGQGALETLRVNTDILQIAPLSGSLAIKCFRKSTHHTIVALMIRSVPPLGESVKMKVPSERVIYLII